MKLVEQEDESVVLHISGDKKSCEVSRFAFIEKVSCVHENLLRSFSSFRSKLNI